jgi:hypothetical protein
MSRTTLVYSNHVILCPHIHDLYKDTYQTKEQAYGNIHSEAVSTPVYPMSAITV